MGDIYDTSDEISSVEAARLMRRRREQILALWRAGVLHGRMEMTVNNRPYRLWVTRASVSKRLHDEARSPLHMARRGLPAA